MTKREPQSRIFLSVSHILKCATFAGILALAWAIGGMAFAVFTGAPHPTLGDVQRLWIFGTSCLILFDEVTSK